MPNLTTPWTRRYPQWFTEPRQLLATVALLLISIVACATPPPATPAPTPEPSPTPVLEEVPAPIESVAIELAVNGGSAAELVVVSGLPNSCHQFKEYRLAREGNRFTVDIINTRQGGAMVACAEIYGLVTTRIPLEGSIAACQQYGIIANGEEYRVQAIAPNIRCAEPTGPDALTWQVGETVAIGDAGLNLTLVEVSQDSRCPSDVVCIRAGDATVLFRAAVPGQADQEFSLTLGGDAGNRDTRAVAGYTVKLVRLEPYPVSTDPIDTADYVAFLEVARQ